MLKDKDISQSLSGSKGASTRKVEPDKKAAYKTYAPKATVNTTTNNKTTSSNTKNTSGGSTKSTNNTSTKNTDNNSNNNSSKQTVNPNSPQGIKAIHGADVEGFAAFDEIPSLSLDVTGGTPGMLKQDRLTNSTNMWNLANAAMNTPKNLPTFNSDEELKNYYESIPDYNAAERLFNGEKKEKYKEKQALSREYRRIKNVETIEQLHGLNISDQDIKDYVDVTSPNYWSAQNKINSAITSNKIDVGDVAEAFQDYNNSLIKKEAKETPVSSTAYTFATNPVESGLGVGKKIYQYATGKPITQGQTYTNLAREAISEDMSDIGKFAYGVGTSIGDMGTAMALALPTGGSSMVSAGIMGVEKADQVMNEAIERNLSPNQILLEGIASGVTTALTEQIPMGKFEDAARAGFNGAQGLALVKEMGKVFWNAGFPEAVQEMAEDGADTIADWLITGDKSKVNARIRELQVNNHLTAEQAKDLAWREWAFQTVMDGFAGLLSGGATGELVSSFGAMTGENNPYAIKNPVDISEEHLRELGYTPEEISQIQAEVIAEEIPGLDNVLDSNTESNLQNAVEQALVEEEQNTPAVEEMVQNPVEDTVLNDEDILPLDLFEQNDNTVATKPGDVETIVAPDGSKHTITVEEKVDGKGNRNLHYIIDDGNHSQYDYDEYGFLKSRFDRLSREDAIREINESYSGVKRGLPEISDSDMPFALPNTEENTTNEKAVDINNMSADEVASVVGEELGQNENSDWDNYLSMLQNGEFDAEQNAQNDVAADQAVMQDLASQEIASLDEQNQTNNSLPADELASILNQYQNEQSGTQNLPQINPEDRYTSENITRDDLATLEDISDVRERGYSDTLKNKTDAPASLKAQFVNDPALYRELHNKDTQAKADEIFNNNSLDVALDKARSMIAVKNPVAVPLAYRVSNELVAQGRMDAAVDLTNSLAQALTEAGQFTQAVTLNMLNNNPIAGREYMIRKLDALNAEGTKRFKSKWTNFELTEEESALFDSIDLGDTDAINDAYAQIWARVSRDIPVSFWQKLQELRRVGLLCNMRTIVRNLSSNTAMLPLRWTAGRITALAEFAYKMQNSDYTRTEALAGAGKKARKLAKEFCDLNYAELFGENVTQWNDADAILRNAQVFKGGKIDEAFDKVLTLGANLVKKADATVYEYINKTTGGTIDKVMDMYNIDSIESFMKLVNGDVFGKDINPSILESIRNFTYYMLGEFGDTPFVKANFTSKLASYIQANHIENIEDIPQDAIALAVQEANKATFHDNSFIAKGLQDIRKGFNTISGPVELGNLLLTFAKTPGNIGARILEYSPAGLVTALGQTAGYNISIGKINKRIATAQENLDNATNASEKLKAQKELNNLKAAQQDNYQKMTNALTLLGQGATGTLGIVIGRVLARMGFAIGNLSNDKRKRKYQQNVLNMQDSSFQIGDTSYSYDFLQPALSPIQYGVIIEESFQEQTDNFWQSLGNAGLAVADSWLESTPMKSFSEMFSGSGSKSENIMNAIIDIPTSWMPAQIGAIARIEDRTMRNTYDNTSKLKTLKNEVVAKTPFLSKTLPASYDLWGRERERQESKESAAFAQLVNPGSTKFSNKTDIDDELLNLYDSIGDERVFPHGAAYSYTIGGETYKLDNKQQSEYQKIMGEASYDLAQSYIKSDAWKNATDEVKAKGLDELYSFGEALAKREILGAYPDSMQKVLDIYDKKGIEGVKEYYANRLSYQTALGNASVEGSETLQDIYNNLGDAGVEQYGKAQKLAEEKGASKISKDDWNLYRNGDMDAFNKSVEARALLEKNGIEVTDAKKKYIEQHGEGGIYNLKEAEKVVQQIQKGVDDYGNPVYRSLDSTMLDIYDTYGIQGLRQYKDAVNSAIAYGADSITTDEYKTYRSGDIDGFGKMVSSRIILQSNDLPNTQFYRNYIEEYGTESIPVLKEAADAIVQIQSGVDKYGDAKYFSPNEKLINIYKKSGKDGVKFYADLYTKDDIDGDPSSRTLHDTVPYLESMDMSDAEKGYWLSYFVSGKKVNSYLANNDYAGLYRYYAKKY